MHKFVYKYNYKLQITPLKFKDVWILHFEISKFRFYPLKVGGVEILDPDILEFGFYHSKI